MYFKARAWSNANRKNRRTENLDNLQELQEFADRMEKEGRLEMIVVAFDQLGVLGMIRYQYGCDQWYKVYKRKARPVIPDLPASEYPNITDCQVTCPNG